MDLTITQKQGYDALIKATAGLSKQHQAYVLATAWHETGRTMQPIVERGGPKYFAKYEVGTPIGRSLGNTIKGDGLKFIGRGYVQITGRANYAKFSKLLGIDIVAKPDLALAPSTATQIIVTGMTKGLFTGKKMSDYTTFRDMRRVVNGMDKADVIAGYAVEFLSMLEAVPAPIIAAPAPAPAVVMSENKTDIQMTPNVSWWKRLFFKSKA
jgi:putative chitinase